MVNRALIYIALATEWRVLQTRIGIGQAVRIMLLAPASVYRAYPVHRAVCLSARKSSARRFIFGFSVVP